MSRNKETLKDYIALLKYELEPAMDVVVINHYNVDWNAIQEEIRRVDSKAEKVKFNCVPEVVTVKDILDEITRELDYDKEEIYYSEIPDRYFIESVKSAKGAEILAIQDSFFRRSMIDRYILKDHLEDRVTFEFDKEYLTEDVLNIKLFIISNSEDFENFKKSKPYKIKMTVRFKTKNYS